VTSSPARGKTLVLGLGNDILTDDAIGLRIVRELQSQCSSDHDLHFKATNEMGLVLLDLISGYDELVLIDSIQTTRAPPGTLHLFELADFAVGPLRSPHFLGVSETIAFGKALGIPMPARVRVYGIEVADPFTLGTRMTLELESALPSLTASIAKSLSRCDTKPHA
jgi:hydrogenase maturation protease